MKTGTHKELINVHTLQKINTKPGYTNEVCAWNCRVIPYTTLTK
jgi:hypothetical protein